MGQGLEGGRRGEETAPTPDRPISFLLDWNSGILDMTELG